MVRGLGSLTWSDESSFVDSGRVGCGKSALIESINSMVIVEGLLEIDREIWKNVRKLSNKQNINKKMVLKPAFTMAMVPERECVGVSFVHNQFR